MLQGQPNRTQVAVVRNGMVQHAARNVEPGHAVIVQVKDSRIVAIDGGCRASKANEHEEISEEETSAGRSMIRWGHYPTHGWGSLDEQFFILMNRVDRVLLPGKQEV